MSNEVLERLVKEVVSLRRRVEALETQDGVIQNGRFGNSLVVGNVTTSPSTGAIYASGDIYPAGNEAGVQQRLDGFLEWTEHWDGDSMPSGWNWAGPPFSTPNVQDFTAFPSIFYFGHSGVAQSEFLYRPVTGAWHRRAIMCRVLTSEFRYNSAGLRMDDGSDDNYVELRIDFVYGSGLQIQSVWRDGGGTINSATLLVNQPPGFFMLGIRAGGSVGSWEAYCDGGTTFYPTFLGSGGGGKTWAPTRVGIFRHSTVPSRYCMLDAWYASVEC